MGIPGVVSHVTGVVKNANSTWLIGRPLQADLEARLSRPVRLANDANCFTLSEAIDGAGRGFETVFGVILGTGVGGGIAIRQRIHEGPNQIAGEWGHNPLPWMTDEERATARRCYCGKVGCVETFLSGPGFERDDAGRSGAGDTTSSGRGGRRPSRHPGAGRIRGTAGPRARRRHQPARPRRGRPGGRDVQPAGPAGTRCPPCLPQVRLLRHGADQGRPELARRFERGARGGVAVDPRAGTCMNAAAVRALFPGLEDTIYLNTATMNVGCAAARAAYELAVERWSAGRFDWMEAERAGEDARAMFARDRRRDGPRRSRSSRP